MVALASSVSLAEALPAFPGAVGYGTDTPGGRGGRVITVTTLADDGPGSLREAVTAKGPRTIVFRVAGEIRLKSHLRITEPFVTVAGQTAPGSGITLRDAGLYVNTHDVVIRFLRSRVGDSLVEEFDTQDALQISGDDTYNVVVDHCSFSWSIDEGVGIRVPAHDITFSHNIISEALRQPFSKEQIGKERSHSMALILSGGPTRTSLHNNLLALCNSRNPRIQGGRHDFINNVVYGWGWLTGTFSRDPEVNFIGNYYKRGPASKRIKAICEKADQLGRLYVKGNISAERPTDDLPEWEPIVAAPKQGHFMNEPFPSPKPEIIPAQQAYKRVMIKAGATVPMRDAIDRRIVRSVRLGMGEKIDRPADVGGYAPIEEGEPYPDEDGDGMDDHWEMAQGFDPSDADDGKGDADHDGYTNLEEFLQYLVEIGSMERPDVFSVVYDAPQDVPFTVRAGDNKLGVHRVGGQVYYTHAWFRDTNRITVEGVPAEWGEATFFPPRYEDDVFISGGDVSFDVVEEGPRVITWGSGSRKIRLYTFFDDFPIVDRHPFRDNTIDTMEYGVVGYAGDVTENIQKAIDDCAKDPNKQIVFIHKGIYPIGQIRIPSGVELHLGRGTQLIFERSGGEAGILFDNVENAALTGPGSVAGTIEKKNGKEAPLVFVRNSREVRIADLVLKGEFSSGVMVQGGHSVELARVKVIGTRDEGSAIQLVDTKNVRVHRSFLMGLVGCGYRVTPFDLVDEDRESVQSNIRMQECVVIGSMTCIAFGQGVVRDLWMRDLDLSSRAVGVLLLKVGGGTIEQLVFRDSTIHFEEPNPKFPGSPFGIIAEGLGGRVKDILFDRVVADSYAPSWITVESGPPLEDIKFWGVEIAADSGQDVLFNLKNVRDPQFRFLYYDWPGHPTEGIDHLFKLENVENMKAPPEEIFATHESRP